MTNTAMINAMLILKGIVYCYNTNRINLLVNISLPEDTGEFRKQISLIKSMLSEYISPKGVTINREANTALINMRKTNPNLDIRMFHAGNYPTI